VIIGAGNLAYTSGMRAGDPINWQIFRAGEALTDPETGELLGYEAIHVGDAKVKRFGAPSTVEITRTKQEINQGDRSCPPASRPSRPTSPTPGQAPQGRDPLGERRRHGFRPILDRDDQPRLARRRGSRPCARDDAQGRPRLPHALRKAAARRGPVPQLGQPELRRHAQPRGERHGGRGGRPRAGDRRGGRTFRSYKLPDERSGLLFVFRTFEKLSYGMILKAVRPISVGDVVQTP